MYWSGSSPRRMAPFLLALFVLVLGLVTTTLAQEVTKTVVETAVDATGSRAKAVSEKVTGQNTQLSQALAELNRAQQALNAIRAVSTERLALPSRAMLTHEAVLRLRAATDVLRRYPIDQLRKELADANKLLGNDIEGRKKALATGREELRALIGPPAGDATAPAEGTLRKALLDLNTAALDADEAKAKKDTTDREVARTQAEKVLSSAEATFQASEAMETRLANTAAEISKLLSATEMDKLDVAPLRVLTFAVDLSALLKAIAQEVKAEALLDTVNPPAAGKADAIRKFIVFATGRLSEAEGWRSQVQAAFDDLWALDFKDGADAAGMKIIKPGYAAKKTNFDANVKEFTDYVSAYIGPKNDPVGTTLQVALPLVRESIDTQQKGLLETLRKLQLKEILGPEADGHLVYTREFVLQLRQLDTDWQQFAPRLTGRASDPPYPLKATRNNVELVDGELRRVGVTQQILLAAVEMLDQGLSGDLSRFVHDQVRLYYFTDIPRLLQALNPAAEIINKDALRTQEVAAQARRQLTEADADLSTRLHELGQSRRALAQIRQDIAHVQAVAKDSDNVLKREQSFLEGLNRQKALLDKRQENEKDQAEKDRISLEQTRLTTAITGQNKEVQSAQQARDAAVTERDKLRDEQADLPRREREARTAVEAAQAEVVRLRRLSLGLAQEESEAFARARDNAPFFYAPGRSSGTDPARRVMLFAYPDSKTIFIRGLAGDVEATKELISAFDRPAPQAKITLWTMQFNGTEGAALHKLLSEVDKELSAMRSNIAGIQDLLRDSITSEVNRKAGEARTELERLQVALPEFKDRERLYRYAFYAPEVRMRLGYELSPKNAVIFNDPRYIADVAYVTQWTLPDPASATTAGQMLFVLSLANRPSQLRIIADFDSRLGMQFYESKNADGKLTRNQTESFSKYFNTRMTHSFPLALFGMLPDEIGRVATGLTLRNDPDYQAARDRLRAKRDADVKERSGSDNDAVARRALADRLGDALTEERLQVSGDPNSVSSNQLEVLLAIQTQAREAAAAEIRHLIRQIGRVRADGAESGELQDELRRQYLPILGWLQGQLAPDDAISRGPGGPGGRYGAVSGTTRGAERAVPESTPSFYQRGLSRVLPNDRRALNSAALEAFSPEDLLKMDRAAWQYASLVGERNALSRANPRVARADEMIKRMMQAAEEDLDQFFTVPALDQIRKLSMKYGNAVQFGSMQRESILATNRMVARVDPNANASVELEQATNLLESATQLAELGRRFHQEQRKTTLGGGLAAAGGAKLAGSGALSALGWGGAISILGALAAQPGEPQGEVYSINSGNLFQVTPVFDPSGQALRFKFDFVANTRVQEPDATTNPTIPRVERHTVNTEVQLSNFELREISRFETNARVGVPVKRTGGLPFVRDLSIFKDIPLLGYYTKQKGSKGVRQQSLILGQTAVYPTVADLVGVMVDVAARPDLDGDMPPYLRSLPAPRKEDQR